MLIQKIQADPVLINFLCDDCEENGVGINIGSEVRREDFIIIRVDEYYKEYEKSDDRPKSPDCLIIQHCGESRFVIWIVELKAIETLKTENPKNILRKFQDCFDDFMCLRFAEYFYDNDYDIRIKLILISDPSESRKDNKGKPTRLDNLLALPHCRFGDKKYPLDFRKPNPTIQPCQ